MHITLENAINIANLLNFRSIIFKIADGQIKVVFYSDSIPQMFGYEPDDFDNTLHTDCSKLISRYDYEYLYKGFFEIAHTKKSYSYTIQVKKKNGGLCFLSGVAAYFAEENDDLYYYSSIYDSSESKDKKKSELIQNAERYHKAIEFANIATWDYDIINKKFLYEDDLNKFFDFTFTNLNIPEAILSSRLIDKDDIPEYLESYRKLTAGYKEVTRENWFHFPNSNTPKYIRVKYTVEFNKDNIPVVAHGMLIDLTEQKNAEIAFNLRSEALIKNNVDNICINQANLSNNTIKSAMSNYAYLKDFTICESFDDLIAQIVDKIPGQNDKIHFINTFSRNSLLSTFDKSNYQVNLEHSLYIKKDCEIFVKTTANLIKNPINGDVECVLNIININYNKTIENLVNGTVQREYDYIALVYIKTNIFFIIDRYNVDLNEENEDFLGYFTNEFKRTIQSEDELEYLLSEFNYPNLIEKINTYGEYTLQYNTSDNYEKNKHKILRFAFLNNKRDVMTVSCHDTTKLFNEELEQKRKLSNALVAAEKANIAKSEFLSLVSHDIRTPLNGIMGMLELASDQDDINVIRGYLNKAKTSSSYLLGLLNDVLDMSKIESGKIELKPETYPYSEFEEYLSGIIQPLCDKKNLHFNFITDIKNKAIYVDKLRFNQIMFNILSNSCKYTNPGGNIELKIRSDTIDEKTLIAYITISDNGIGMSDEFQKHLFESFSQENRPGVEITEGSGLGLSIAYNLVKLMGGEIAVESIINQGTIFKLSFILPYKEITDEHPIIDEVIDTEPIRKDYSGKRFLLCEDNEINQEIALQILTNVGAKVDIANDGLEAVQMYKKAKSYHYDAIFMDIRMPNMDGMAATKEIRKSKKKDSKTIPVIAMTANAMSEDRMECIEAGMNAYIPKPINIHQMYALMTRIIN